MTPDEKRQFDELKQIVRAICAVEDVPFIESIKRRGAQGLSFGGTQVATSISQSVRNAAGDGTTTVAAQPDTKLQIVLPNGTVYYLGAYTS